ncbi:MAG: hypothetical protein L0332_32640 [Chloroflexi bacterium]|nr:hypothetical protein [Chloroflexota bacterium]MCI0579617.1 hypothetical protein [Chloroflexota bacterium]MCI0644822.1 hypothetical protein [Chloroflexota bacterium]MCI0731452.1 hypothetical protein [Chloroflexota bacterium]
MRQESAFNRNQGLYFGQPLVSGDQNQPQLGQQLSRLADLGAQMPRQAIIGLILVVALLAFEIFNFDTTQYALRDFLGDTNFLGIGWATILAIAFCAIDFAGLAHLFTPQRGREEPREIWYLMGAWLLGATMNALMTWWAISLTLLSHEFGNEVMSREQLLQIVPVFVAVLVWLTRILFIGAFSVAGDHFFQPAAVRQARPEQKQYQPAVGQPMRPQSRPVVARNQAMTVPPMSDDLPHFLQGDRAEPEPVGEPETITFDAPRRNSQNNGRVRQRPPLPPATRQRAPAGVAARSRRG